jgi:hypothetical protein
MRISQRPAYTFIAARPNGALRWIGFEEVYMRPFALIIAIVLLLAACRLPDPPPATPTPAATSPVVTPTTDSPLPTPEG